MVAITAPLPADNRDTEHPRNTAEQKAEDLRPANNLKASVRVQWSRYRTPLIREDREVLGVAAVRGHVRVILGGFRNPDQQDQQDQQGVRVSF